MKHCIYRACVVYVKETSYQERSVWIWTAVSGLLVRRGAALDKGYIIGLQKRVKMLEKSTSTRRTHENPKKENN
jgi:hypothetical protein